MNLAQSKKDVDDCIKVKLLFVRAVNEVKAQAGKHDWALFLSTDSQLSDEKILTIYALRWGSLRVCAHFYMLFLDGVYAIDDYGKARLDDEWIIV